MSPVTIFDTLELQATPEKSIELKCRWASGGGSPREPIPDGPRNLAFRAARLLQEAADVREGVRISLTKRIPSAAGLGGASSNAASVLLAANEAWRLRWPLSRLAELASQLGSDVPLFLYRCPAVARGRGELLEQVQLPRMHFVVVKPHQGLSTARVYQHVDLEECGSQTTNAIDLVTTLRRGDRVASNDLMTNDLEFAARRLSTTVTDTFEHLLRAGLQPHMSGSGTSCFASCRSSRSAQRWAKRLRTVTRSEVFAASTL